MLDAFERSHHSIRSIEDKIIGLGVALQSTILMYHLWSWISSWMENSVSSRGKLRNAFKVGGAADLPPALTEAPDSESYQSSWTLRSALHWYLTLENEAASELADNLLFPSH